MVFATASSSLLSSQAVKINSDKDEKSIIVFLFNFKVIPPFFCFSYQKLYSKPRLICRLGPGKIPELRFACG